MEISEKVPSPDNARLLVLKYNIRCKVLPSWETFLTRNEYEEIKTYLSVVLNTCKKQYEVFYLLPYPEVREHTSSILSEEDPIPGHLEDLLNILNEKYSNAIGYISRARARKALLGK